MSYYVYRYVHPDYPWLYVGLTTDLDFRIHTHNHSSGDNIDRKWEKQLNESTIYYHECSDEQDMKTTEKYLINTFKPIINKADKSTGTSSVPPIDIGWTIYDWKKHEKEQKIRKNKAKGIAMISWKYEYHKILSEYFFDKCLSALNNGYSMITFDLAPYNRGHRDHIVDNIATALIISDNHPTGWTLIHADSSFIVDKNLTYAKFHLNKKSDITEKGYELTPYKLPPHSNYQAVYLGKYKNGKKWSYSPMEWLYMKETFNAMDNAQFSYWDESPFIETWSELSKEERMEALNNILPGV